MTSWLSASSSAAKERLEVEVGRPESDPLEVQDGLQRAAGGDHIAEVDVAMDHGVVATTDVEHAELSQTFGDSIDD